MSKISGNKKKSVVKIFFNLFLVAGLGWGTVAGAQAAEAIPSSPELKLNAVLTYGQYQEVNRKQSCQALQSKIDNAEKDIGRLCREAGAGKSCASNVRTCAEAVSEESYSDIDSMMTGVNTAYAAIGIDPSSMSADSKCPQYNGRDYFTERKDYEKELKEDNKELAKLNDDKADLQEKYNERMVKLQETLSKAQEQLKKDNSQLDEEERRSISAFMENQARIKEELRKKGSELIKLRGSLIQSQRDRTAKLITLSENSAKRSCMGAVRKARKEYDQALASSSGNQISQAQQKKKELTDLYTDCMEQYDQQRIALNEAKNQEQESLNKDIENTQTSVEEIQNSLNLAASQLEEIKEANVKKKNDASQSLMELANRSKQEMEAAFAKLQENNKTLMTRSANLQSSTFRTNAKMLSMGPAPRRGSKATIDEVSSELDAAANRLISTVDEMTANQCTISDATANSKKRAQEFKGTR